MVKNIHFVKYRKLINIDFDFSPHVNSIAGTNGTCKSSLLYIIGNSFQSVSPRNNSLNDKKCMSIITALNNSLNPKIECLVRESKKYNDPAKDVTGTLYTVNYFDGKSVPFRKHNSIKDFRFALKPYYKKGAHESLPVCPVIYLGISRLLPFGEISDELSVNSINKRFPDKYQNIFKELFKEFTHFDMSIEKSISVENSKKRTEFSTDIDGIDSNTISAGEDNLSIILTALVSLRYYYESLDDNTGDVKSVLLIDELDSTLHPSFQRRLLNVIRLYSINYKIQVFFTTQSSSLLEYSLKKNDNIVYLIDNRTSVHKLDNPDWFRVKMQLEGLTENDLFMNSKIPVLLEDDEARWMFDKLLCFFENINRNFSWIKNHLHFVDVKAGSDVLKSLFSDGTINSKTIGWICILDGDQNSDMTNCILTLPGKKPIEQLMYDYTKQLYDSDDSFWIGPACKDGGYSKNIFLDNIKADYDSIESEIQNRIQNGESVHGLKRTKLKKFFNTYEHFFKYVFMHWLSNPDNAIEIKTFYNDLGTMYKKVCVCAGLPNRYWIDDLLDERR